MCLCLIVKHFPTIKKGHGSKKINHLKDDSPAKVRALINDGYVKSDFPVSRSPKYGRDESDLRANEMKWDTIVRRHDRLKGSSLLNPALTLRGIARNSFVVGEDNIGYHVVITVKAPKYQGSLYNAVLQTYQNLAPIEIRNVNRILVDR